MSKRQLTISAALTTTGAIVLLFATDIGTAIGVHLIAAGWAWFIVKYPKEKP